MPEDVQVDGQRAWMFLAVTGTRHYQGNEGYADDLEKFYRYDSNVGNHRQVSAGDFILLRQNHSIVAAAVIARIDSAPSTKTKNLCPLCGSSRVNQRKAMRPPYSCSDCKGEFETPRRRENKVTAYTAWYENFIRPAEPFPDALFRPVWIQVSDQMSMRGLDAPRLAGLLAKHWPAAEELFGMSSTLSSIQPEDSAVDEPPPADGYKPSTSDERAKVMKEIRQRRGQQKFRKSLLRAFKRRCAFSGCRLVHLLEAAHIAPYRGEADHHRSNGLLLRTDLHTLFDLNLVAVDPASMTLFISPDIRGFGYDDMDGLRLDKETMKGVSIEALTKRWKVFRAVTGGSRPA